MYSLQAHGGFLLRRFQNLVVFSLLSSLLISSVSSTYNPYRKHFKENFDPAEADPKRNLSCVGDSYGLRLPLLEDGFNPNGLSMQKLCVKPQYGGGEQHQHAGAYCFHPIEPLPPSKSENDSESDIDNDFVGEELPVMYGKVIFDPHRYAQTSRRLQNPRVLQACIYRCFCNYGVEDVSIQPPSDHFPIQKLPSGEGYQLQIDIENDFTLSYVTKMSGTALGDVDSSSIFKKPQVDSDGLGFLVQPTYMNLDPGNEIECTGDLPSFVLPSPYTYANFSSVQELCAVALSGGNK